MKIKKLFDRSSLFFNFSILFLSIFFVFLVLIFFSYIKFVEYKKLVSDISDTSIPKVIRISNVYSNTKELTLLLDKMVNSNSNATKRLTYQRALQNIEFIEQSNINLNKGYLQNIKNELKNITNLMKKEISYKKQIDLKNLEFDTQNRLFVQKLSKKKSNYEILSYLEEIKFLLLFRNNLRIKEFFKIKNTIKEVFHLMEKNITNKEDIKILQNIKVILFHKDGILDLQEEKLKIKSKIERMWVFIKSLINNFLDEIRYLSVKNNQNLINEVEQSSNKLESQALILLLSFLACLIYLALILFYFKRKIIQRLVNLNNFISKRDHKNNTILEDKDNDEISYIIKSFNFFAKKLEELSFTDSLTGVANKRLFFSKFKDELAHVKRENVISSCIIMDIDNFKLYNDNYGHLEGDNCLKTVAKALKKVIKRDLDVIARYGGEEFICILSNTDIQGSKTVASSFVQAVRTLEIPHKFSQCSPFVTISVGIKTFDKEETKKEMDILEKADKALYAAKKSGKNTFVHYDEEN
ncbi:MAG: hypothetical protein CSA86_00535 [Arcobacter sp.]|nr:MAG: hypothetical protein CSA86_00535 [Arcobacter sp.]